MCLGFGVVVVGCGLVACCGVISGQISALLLDVDSLGLLFGCLWCCGFGGYCARGWALRWRGIGLCCLWCL